MLAAPLAAPFAAPLSPRRYRCSARLQPAGSPPSAPGGCKRASTLHPGSLAIRGGDANKHPAAADIIGSRGSRTRSNC